MVVNVRLLGHLAQTLKREAGPFTVELEDGGTLLDILRILTVPEAMVMLFTVNGKVTPSDYQPNDGDDVALIQPVSGG
jgi:sulfur carrier protein ThiS